MFLGFCTLWGRCHNYSALLSSCQSGRKQGSVNEPAGLCSSTAGCKKQPTRRIWPIDGHLQVPALELSSLLSISSRFSAAGSVFLHRALRQSPQGKKPEEVSSGTHGRGDRKEAGIYYVPGTTPSLPHAAIHTHEDLLRQALIIPK